jgi:DNA-binding NarL/FixJ family response regulator
MYDRIDYILEALANGAIGYMTKETSPSRLAEGVRKVYSGEYYFDQIALEALIRKAQERPQHCVDVKDSGYEQLTAREQEVMRLLAQGIPVKRIAQSLCISYRTVENHRTNLYKKLGLHNDAELVHYATRIGIIDFD